MAKEIILTPLAKEDIDKILDYLLTNWNATVATEFLDRLEGVFELIAQTPQIYPFINKARGLQRCFITKHNMLCFIETAEYIKVITIFDTRQDPGRLSTIT